MCRDYKLTFLTGAVSCYPALMVNLTWFTDEKFMFIVSALSNMKG